MAGETPLHERHASELPKGTPALEGDELERRLGQVGAAWERDGDLLRRTWEFADFRDAFGFATRVALVAEREFHHPDLFVTWGKVTVTTTTHSIGGLSDNDFILAARLDRLG
jgi:4a-hydroxytetrahydrobiopterin dehydratase